MTGGDGDHDPERDGDRPDDSAHPGYSLDELAAATGVPARTIRFYRQSGLIDPPERRGRRAYYAASQLERLRHIASLREHGLGLEAVAKLLEDPEGEGQSLTDVLRMSDELRRPWIEDRSATLDALEVRETLGVDDPHVLELLERFDIIERTARTDVYHVPSVATLELAGDLLAAGIGPELAHTSWERMRAGLADLARELVTLYLTAADGPAVSGDPEVVAAAFRRLRPVAMQGIQLVFAHEIEQALSDFVATGGLLPRPTADRDPGDDGHLPA